MSDRVLTSTNIPAKFRRTLFSDYDVDRGREYIIKRVSDWEPTADVPGLLLVGAPGTGKTMLACATLNEFQSLHAPRRRNIPEKTRVFLRQQKYPVYFMQIAEWVQLQLRLFNLHTQLERGVLGDPEEYLTIDKLLQDLMYRVEMLVLDDIGKEHRTTSGFAEDAFDLLVRTRANAGLATIFTTNTHLERWSVQYSESMRSFIARSCKMIKFCGER